MESRKTLYRRLAKKFHPDLADSPSEKVVHAQLMVEINSANARGDFEVLKEIDSMGLTYLVYKFYAEGRHSSVGVDTPEEESRPRARTQFRSKFRGMGRRVLRVLHPYSLLILMNEGDDTSRIQRLFAFFTSTGWTYAFYKVWLLLGAFSSWLVSSGYPHESFVGLGVVLLQGTLILIALPCVAPLFIYGISLSFLLSLVYLATLFASNALALFHPLLAYVPPLVVIPFLCWLGWNYLGDD